jgi:hypothetical protein
VKTIISITEVILYNLFPATLAAPIVMFIKEILPLVGVASIRMVLYIWDRLQKTQHMISQRVQHAKLLEGINFNRSH